jgi:Fatty acid cis/trans isomerase (CTI)
VGKGDLKGSKDRIVYLSHNALEAFRANPNRFDLVITDTNMPNMTGAFLAMEMMRIRLKNGKYLAISIVINRWHNNVTYLFGEGGQLDASKDRADFIHGPIGSYPNYFVDIREEDLPDFFDLLAPFEKSPRDYDLLAKYGVNRADDRLWDTYDWFQKRFYEDEPVHAGLFDLNRYYHYAQ